MRAGFSLVELSVVLVIISLLVGGVITGKNLIRSASVKTVITEFQTYKNAAAAFKDKHIGLPGDLPFAEDIWGSMTNCGAASPSGSGTQTCNGNGDGKIALAGASGQTAESYGFWQQLSNEGLIEGEYTGISGSSGTFQAVPDENAPKAALKRNVVWNVSSFPYTGSSYMFNTPANTSVMVIGVGNTWNFGAALSVREANYIDNKLDDGHATQGDVWAVRWDQCTTSTGAGDLQDYDFSAVGLQCGLMFLNPF